MEWQELPRWVTPNILIEAWHDSPDMAFLDSSDHVNPYGRYSFLCFDPFLHLVYRDGKVILDWKDEGRNTESDPWMTLRDLLRRFKITDAFPLDIPTGGAIGYLSYDLGMELEKVRSSSRPALKWPLSEFAFYDILFCFNRMGGSNIIISTGLPFSDKEKQHRHARNRMKEVLERLQQIEKKQPKATDNQDDQGHFFQCELESNFNHQSYLDAIEKIKGYIAAGDVYQVNLSQSFTGEVRTHGWPMYQRIRKVNRVPFGAYLRFGDREVLCFSMERFLYMKDNRVETRPIKGTRPRGKNHEEDLRLSRELFDSKKDQAELVMIVDMERNDLGKVCRPGTIRVHNLFEVEKYATVFHLVSTIRGTLDDSSDHIDCMTACLPGGSITGAPKIRAMEIIDELEGIKREVYCGAIGYFGFNQVSDFNIPIRTIQKEGRQIRFNAGGGILYDSDPESEYQETLHKVRSFIECFSPTKFIVS